jgi:hypothetical protein
MSLVHWAHSRLPVVFYKWWSPEGETVRQYYDVPIDYLFLMRHTRIGDRCKMTCPCRPPPSWLQNAPNMMTEEESLLVQRGLPPALAKVFSNFQWSIAPLKKTRAGRRLTLALVVRAALREQTLFRLALYPRADVFVCQAEHAQLCAASALVNDPFHEASATGSGVFVLKPAYSKG